MPIKRLPSDKWRGRHLLGISSAKPGGLHNKSASPWFWNDDDHPILKRNGRAYDEALAAVDVLKTRREELKKTGKFTDLGISEQLARDLMEDSLPAIRRARAAADSAERELAERRAKLTLPKPDPDDLETHKEIRAMLRAMPAAERDRFIRTTAREDATVRAALLHGHPITSGIGRATHDAMTQEALRGLYGEQFEEIDELGESAKVLKRLADAGRVELRDVSGLPPEAFEAVASVAERNSGNLPYRITQQVDGDRVIEIAEAYDRQAKTWRRATADEIMRSRSDSAGVAA